jgi:hypothetical protein
VKYVKRNAIAGLRFASFAALERHLAAWIEIADQRIHGTTHAVPAVRFADTEAAALRALPAHPLPPRQQRLRRRVATDALVDVDTIRYSVPHRLVRDHVEVVVEGRHVQIFHGTALVATHVRAHEPYSRVIDAAHYDGLWRSPSPADVPTGSPLAALGRELADYAAVVTDGAS